VKYVVSEITLYESSKPRMPPQHLFAGVKQDNYTLTIYVAYRALHTETTLNVSVVVSTVYTYIMLY